jgi:disulfide bond formation protein DsbB
MNLPTVQANAVLDESDADDPTWLDHLADLLAMSSRHLALLAATIATGGSLFMSEVLGWVPCVLCWYQRILMYPLALILTIGIVRRDRGLHGYVLPFSIAGMGVALYHYLLIKTTWLPPPACTVGIPCTTDYLNVFGFINVPFLALVAFTIITGMMLVFARLHPLTADDSDAAPATADPAPRFSTDTLAVIMIVVGVALAFLLGSSFV